MIEKFVDIWINKLLIFECKVLQLAWNKDAVTMFVLIKNIKSVEKIYLIFMHALFSFNWMSDWNNYHSCEGHHVFIRLLDCCCIW